MTRKEYCAEHTNHWTERDLLNAFYAAQQKEGKPGLTDYAKFPASIECAPFLPFFTFLSEKTDIENETGLIASATLQGFIQRALLHGDNDTIDISPAQFKPSDSVLLHTHTNKFFATSRDIERDALQQPIVGDCLSTLDTTKLLLYQYPFITIGVIHGSSVMFLVRSNETPAYDSKNFRYVFRFLASYVSEFSALPLYIVEELFGDSPDSPRSHRLNLQSTQKFARITHSGLYQISNFRQSTRANRIG